MLTRRDWIRVSMLGAASAAGALVTRPKSLAAFSAVRIDVYKTPTCQCCKAWIAHLNGNGFSAVAHDVPKLDPINGRLGIPLALQACHAASVGPYAIAGHVPADLIQRMISEQPAHIVGLAVPGMPVGSPGMENQKKVLYTVFAYERNGTTHVYAKR